MTAQPRTKAESEIGALVLAAGLAFAGLAAFLVINGSVAAGAFLGANGLIFLLWGWAILSGGFAGRRFK